MPWTAAARGLTQDRSATQPPGVGLLLGSTQPLGDGRFMGLGWGVGASRVRKNLSVPAPQAGISHLEAVLELAFLTFLWAVVPTHVPPKVDGTRPASAWRAQGGMGGGGCKRCWPGHSARGWRKSSKGYGRVPAGLGIGPTGVLRDVAIPWGWEHQRGLGTGR